jgi:ribulose-phosphate 3-epimerase
VAIRIHPSILNADFANLEREVGRLASADLVHVDVMDNHFVPNLTFGLPMVERLVEVSPVPLDVHLMIDDPDRWAPGYASAGAASVTFHAEAAADAVATARAIRAAGARAGVALKPDTSAEPWLDRLDEFDLVLVMTVEPGFGGQSFLDLTLPKIRRAAEAVRGADLPLVIQVDGGITEETILRVADAGATVFVAGSSVYGADDAGAAITALRTAATRGRS